MQCLCLFVLALLTLLKVDSSSAAGQIGETCTLDGTSPCVVSNSYCLKNTACQLGICKCNVGYVSASSGSLCLPSKVRLNSACTDSVQCGSLAFCSADTCQCNSNTRSSDGTNCVKGIIKLGDNCTSSAECGDRAICSAAKICACGSTEYKVVDLYSCRYLTYGEYCVNNVCNPNTALTCLNGMCQCASGLQWMRVVYGDTEQYQCTSTASILNRGYGENCHDLKSSCGFGSNIRTCQQGLYCNTCPEDSGSCIRKCLIDNVVKIGDACTADGSITCSVANSYCLINSACQRGVCKCSTGYINLNSTNMFCVPGQVKLGEACLSYAQCGSLASCTSGICQCSPIYRVAADGINCLQGTQVLNGNCTTSSQCGARARCSNGVCACINAEYKPVDAYSCRYLTNGESCTTSSCDTNVGLQCISGQCQCPSGQKWVDVSFGGNTHYFQCVLNQATFNRGYGEVCHDLVSGCGYNTNLKTCQAGLYCQECPEDKETCIRRCLINTDTSYCLSGPCQNGANCTNLKEGYSCSCLTGWTGVHCDSSIPETPVPSTGSTMIAFSDHLFTLWATFVVAYILKLA